MTGIEHVARARRRYVTALWAAGILAFTLILTTLALVLVQSARNGATARAIRGCTTPGGSCYDRSRAETGAAIEQIVTSLRASDREQAARIARACLGP